MDFTHKVFGSLRVKEITQRDIEKFLGGLSRDGVGELVKVEYDGAAVRKAVTLELITTPHMQLEDVDEMKPAKVRWLAECLGAAIADALSVDPLA